MRTLLLFAFLVVQPAGQPQQDLASLTWSSIPGSDMKSFYDPAIDGLAPKRYNSFEAIQDAWGGAVCVEDELYLWGGGHGDGANNGVYAVNVLTGEWRRVTQTTQSVYYNADSQTNPDGSPAARHTYDSLVSDGQAVYISSGGGFSDRNAQYPDQDPPEPPTNPDATHSSWRLDLATSTWANFAPANRSSNHGAAEIADGVMRITGTKGAKSYDIATNSWTAHARGGEYSAGMVLVYSPDSDRFYGLGAGHAWHRTSAQWGTSSKTSIPFAAATLGKYWGNTYYSPERLVLLWSGGRSMLAYSEVTESWSIITPGGEDPGPGYGAGTFGRFSYCGGRIVVVPRVDRPLFYLAGP